MDVARTIGRALRLLDERTRFRIRMLAVAGVALSILDLLGILLLVPLLAYLGQGTLPDDRVSRAIADLIGGASAERTALVLAGAAAVLFLVKSAASVMLLWMQAGVLNRAVVDLGTRMLRAFAAAPWLTQQTLSTGALVRTAAPGGALYASVTTVAGATLGMVSDGAVFIAVFVALVFVDPFLAIGGVAYLVFAGIVYARVVRGTLSSRGAVVQSESKVVSTTILSLVGGIRELTIRNGAEGFVDHYAAAFAALLRSMRVIGVAAAGTRYLLEAVMIGGVALVILLTVAVGSGRTALISIGVLLAAGIRVLPALSNLVVLSNQVRANEPAIQVVEDELASLSAPAISAPRNESARLGEDVGSATAGLTGGFRLEQVGFRYPGRPEDALSGITVAVSPGESLGIVGGSGAGKSTLVDLLLGLVDPTEGRIVVGEADLRHRLAAWRSIIGYVPQDIFLFEGSVAENVAMVVPGTAVDEQRLRDALRLAHLDDVVAGLPSGVATTLGERGLQLSGGQRQRVGIARALYRRPKVLILDEATSALDNETEASVADALSQLHGETTSVVVAHRLSTVRSCDKIAYLESGRVVGLGAFGELQDTCPGFARLVALGSTEGVF